MEKSRENTFKLPVHVRIDLPDNICLVSLLSVIRLAVHQLPG